MSDNDGLSHGTLQLVRGRTGRRNLSRCGLIRSRHFLHRNSHKKAAGVLADGRSKHTTDGNAPPVNGTNVIF